MSRAQRNLLASALSFAFVGFVGAGCKSCGPTDRSTEKQESVEESSEASGATGGEAEEEPSPQAGETSGPLLVRLEWSAYADLDLQLETPPGESGDRQTMTFGAPGPGGGEIDNGDGCPAHRCDAEDRPHLELAVWDEGRDEPLAGGYEVRILYHGNQPADPRQKAEYTVEAYKTYDPDEAEEMEPFWETSGAIGPSDNEVLETVGTFEH